MAKREENNVDWVEELTGEKYAKANTPKPVKFSTPSCSIENVDWVADLTGQSFAKPVKGAVGY